MDTPAKTDAHHKANSPNSTRVAIQAALVVSLVMLLVYCNTFHRTVRPVSDSNVEELLGLFADPDENQQEAGLTWLDEWLRSRPQFHPVEDVSEKNLLRLTNAVRPLLRSSRMGHREKALKVLLGLPGYAAGAATDVRPLLDSNDMDMQLWAQSYFQMLADWNEERPDSIPSQQWREAFSAAVTQLEGVLRNRNFEYRRVWTVGTNSYLRSDTIPADIRTRVATLLEELATEDGDVGTYARAELRNK